MCPPPFLSVLPSPRKARLTATEQVREFARSLGPFRAIFSQAREHNLFEGRWNCALRVCRRRNRRGLDVCHGYGDCGWVLERKMTCKQPVRHATETVNIGSRIRLGARRDLRGKDRRRAGNVPGAYLQPSVVTQRNQTEVHNLN